MATLKKASQTTQSIFNLIPKEFRISLAVIGGGFLAYKIYKKLNPSEEEKKQEQLDTEAQTTKDPATGKTVTCSSRLSYNPSQYKAWAESMYDAFFKTLGTDEDTIYSILNKMNNECDLKQLIADFGLRRQEWTSKEYSLAWFMRDELDEDELSYANRILSLKKINYQF